MLSFFFFLFIANTHRELLWAGRCAQRLNAPKSVAAGNTQSVGRQCGAACFVSKVPEQEGSSDCSFQTARLRSGRSSNWPKASTQSGEPCSSQAASKAVWAGRLRKDLTYGAEGGDQTLPHLRHCTGTSQANGWAFENWHPRSSYSGPGPVLGAAYLPPARMQCHSGITHFTDVETEAQGGQ